MNSTIKTKNSILQIYNVIDVFVWIGYVAGTDEASR